MIVEVVLTSLVLGIAMGGVAGVIGGSVELGATGLFLPFAYLAVESGNTTLMTALWAVIAIMGLVIAGRTYSLMGGGV